MLPSEWSGGKMQQGETNNTTDLMRLFIKIFGIMGMIFIAISLLVPWASYTIFGTNWGLNMNTWGVSTNIPQTIVGEAGYKYLSDPFYINAMQSGITEGIVTAICMILVFIFAIITLLLGLKAFKSIGSEGFSKNYLNAGIIAIIPIALCVVGVIQGSSYGSTIYFQITGTPFSGGFGYTWGFILTIIAMIFFFTNYAIDIYLLQGTGMQKSQSYQKQPQVMYTSQQPPPQQPIQQQPPAQQPPVQQSPPQSPTSHSPPPQSPPPAATQPPKQTETSKRFCNHCGAVLQTGSSFCHGCGAKL